MNNFTEKQREIVARKLGYDGPMQGFDDFLNSSPALGMKYATITDKFATRMAKGGVVKKAAVRKYQAGGDVTANLSPAQQAFYNKLINTPGQGTPSEILGYVKSLNDGQSLATLSVLEGKNIVRSYNGADEKGAIAEINRQNQELANTYNVPMRTTSGVTVSPTSIPAQAVNTPGAGTQEVGVTDAAEKQQASTFSTPVAPVSATTSKTDDATVRTYLASNPNLSDTQIAEKMTEFNVSPEQMSRVTGVPVDQVQQRFNTASSATTGATREQVLAAYAANPKAEANPSEEAISYWQNAGLGSFNATVDAVRADNPTLAASIDEARGTTTGTTTGGSTTTGGTTTGTTTGGSTTTGAIPTPPTTTTGAPGAPQLTTYTAAQTAAPTAAVAGQAAPTQVAGVTNVAAPTPIAAPAPIVAPTATAATTAADVADALSKVTAQQGALSEAAKAEAATQAPATTAVAGMEAAQGVAGTVQGAPTRTVEAGEMVGGPAVDMARVEQTLAQTQAAQGVVTEEMTIQGQLNKLTRDFDAGNPPPWAAASMRAATAQMAARGLGASSMAGQAIIQATLEAATPIAAADAKVFETMGLQNLSNRQQAAMLIGQQRAAFLGQEFDQAFQTKVLNAAKIADIANRNFDAQTTIALENSRLANSMDIANLSARNAVVLGKMAQMSQLETQNLSNRQQVAVENARAALTMDIKNLDNRQQTVLFRAQEMNDALVSDAGFANAVSITNAANTLDAAKVSATLAQSAQQFNAEMLTKVNMANALAANEIGKFNAQQANAREEFNANMVTQINLANAKILAEVSMANTAAVNAANAVNAKNATDLSAAQYAQQSQTYRDLLEMSWKTGESEKDRATQIVAATLTSSASVNAATTSSNAAAIAAIAKAGVTLAVNYDKVKAVIGDFFD